MSKYVDFYFDFGSPTSYLAWTKLPKITQSAGATLNFLPILLGGVHKATGNRSPAEVPRKGTWMNRDLERFAARYNEPYKHNPHFPINTMHLMRGAIGYQMYKPTAFESYVATIFRAMWVDARNLGEQAILADVLQRGGLDPEDFLTFNQDGEVKDRLRAETEAAVERGVFGAPTMFVGEEMYFGQDRLDFVRDALQ